MAELGGRPADGAGAPAPGTWKNGRKSSALIAGRVSSGRMEGGSFLAGGVPEVMLHLRQIGLLDLEVLTATGMRLGEILDWWEKSV